MRLLQLNAVSFKQEDNFVMNTHTPSIGRFSTFAGLCAAAVIVGMLLFWKEGDGPCRRQQELEAVSDGSSAADQIYESGGSADAVPGTVVSTLVRLPLFPRNAHLVRDTCKSMPYIYAGLVHFTNKGLKFWVDIQPLPASSMIHALCHQSSAC
jgi:hypothetical protein